MNNLKESAAQFLCRHRRTKPWCWLGQMAYLVWRAYENRNFDMASNGEEWCLRQLRPLGVRCVFDVGANLGEWTRMCRRHLPDTEMHVFEIAPPLFARLQENAAGLSGVKLNSVGLADCEEEIQIYYSETANYLTTAFKGHLGKEFAAHDDAASDIKSIRAKVIRGDDYTARHGIQAIDFLKIDVEGMESSVLHGFQRMLAAHQIRLIQFEYNTTNIVSRFLLRDAHQFFSELGYRVGKLYPNYVEFRDYHYRQEDFCGPNMIAVRKEDEELQNALAPN